jgi:amino acid permease
MISDAISANVAGDDGFDSTSTPLPPATKKTDAGGDATVSQLIFNLVKSIVGAGVLSLPAGIAAFASAPSAVIPSVALIAIIGGLSGYGFALIGRCCAYTDTTSYRDAWSATVSPSSSWVPATAVTFKTICATLAYSMFLGDTLVSLLSTAGVAASKGPVTLALTGTVLLPLCLMKNLSSLAPFSLVGTLGMVYTAIAMTVRFLSKAYAVPGGRFVMDVAPSLRPKFGPVGAQGILSPSAAILVSMLSTAYMAHFNAPKVGGDCCCFCTH